MEFQEYYEKFKDSTFKCIRAFYSEVIIINHSQIIISNDTLMNAADKVNSSLNPLSFLPPISYTYYLN